MSKGYLRLAELLSLTLVAAGLIGLACFMVYLGRIGEAFGSVVATIPLVVQAIRNVSSSQAMNTMAEQLAKSSPPKEGGE